MAKQALTIAVYSGSGGVGRTFLATNLAVSLHQQDVGRVLLLDASYPLPGEGPNLIGVDRAKSLADMVPLLDRFTSELLASYVVTAPSGVAVMPMLTEVLQAKHVTPEALTQALQIAQDAFDLIVMDLPAGEGPLTFALLEHSDEVCVVSDCTPTALIRAKSCMEYLRAWQIPLSAQMFCANRVPESGWIGAERLAKLVGIPVTAVLHDDQDAVTAASENRKPLVINNARHAISRSIDRLGREIVQRGLRQVHLAEGDRATSVKSTNESEIRDLKVHLHERLVEEIDLRKEDLSYLRDPSKLQEVRVRAEAKIVALVEEEAAHVEPREARRRLVKDLLNEALGLGPLEELLAEPGVTEVMVNRYDQIYAERNGKIEKTAAEFLSNQQLRGAIERIVAPMGRRIDEKVPMVDARLPDGSRVNAIIPPLALKGPSLTIRKFSKSFLGVDDLVGFEAMTEQMATFLGAAVQARLNIVISGGTGSGKTTLLNVLGSFISSEERIVTIEDSAELQLPQDHVVTLESRPPNIEGEGAVTIRDLVRNSLRMRPDRIVIGECRSGEALDMLQAMNTGHDGSLTTVHANQPRDALSRLETMALMSGLDLPSQAIRDQIASAVHLVVQQTRLGDGSRRITYITEVTGMEADTFTCADVFVFRQTGTAPDGKVYGEFMPTGYVPAFIEKLARRGIQVPREIFLHQTA